MVDGAAGRTCRVTVTLPAAAFEHWDETRKRWVVEPGDFTVHVGASSADLRASAVVTVV
ncbi:hypothetical protein FAIPA1_430004 [Frankia sp. AiPs1]